MQKLQIIFFLFLGLVCHKGNFAFVSGKKYAVTYTTLCNENLTFKLDNFMFPGHEDEHQSEFALVDEWKLLKMTDDWDQIGKEFCQFVRRFEKVYVSVPHALQRLKIFAENHGVVKMLNAVDLHAEYSLANSMFADLTALEFKQNHLMNFNTKGDARDIHTFEKSLGNSIRRKRNFNLRTPSRELMYNLKSVLPQGKYINDNLMFDWEKNGKVTTVKNQGTIGTCWAFSAVGVIESQVAIKHNDLVDLSVEQLVECAGNFNKSNGEADCSEFGGWPYLGYSYIKDYGGIFSDGDFPYCSGMVDSHLTPKCFPCMPKAYDKASCGDHSDLYCDVKTTKGQIPDGYCINSPDNVKRTKTKLDYWTKLSRDEGQLAGQLQKLGPVSVALNALVLQFYYKGVVSLPGQMCFPSLNHAVILTGYGEVQFNATLFEHDFGYTLPYWRVKNSWGTSFGEQGYFRIRRDHGECGINLEPSIAFIL